MFTVDASVWVNAYSPAEVGFAASQSLMDALLSRGTPLVEPTLLPVEVAGVIGRTRGDATLARDMAAAIVALPSLVWVPLDDPHWRGGQPTSRLSTGCEVPT